MWFVEHWLCPGPVLATQGNYQLLNLNPLSCVLEHGQKISGKLNTVYILLWMLFFLLLFVVFLPFPFLSLLLPPPQPQLSIPGDEEVGIWSGRLVKGNGFPTMCLNHGTVSHRTLAANPWKGRWLWPDWCLHAIYWGPLVCRPYSRHGGARGEQTSCSSSGPCAVYIPVGEADPENTTYRML